MGAVARPRDVGASRRSSTRRGSALALIACRSSPCSPGSAGGSQPASRPSRHLTPNFVSAATLASPRPFTVSSITPEQAVAVEAPVEPGFARVQRGESIETFAQRLLGDASRWPEIWELNRNQVVGPDGEVWSAAWRLGAGWDLRLPGRCRARTTNGRPAPRTAESCPFTASPSAWAQRRAAEGRRRVRGRRRRLLLGDRRAIPACRSDRARRVGVHPGADDLQRAAARS